MAPKVALIVPVALVVPLLSACDDDSQYAASICTDNYLNIRADDALCDRPDPRFSWAYEPYRAYDDGVDVVYVGQPVDRRIYLSKPPRGVSAARIDRGYPALRPAGSTAPSVRVSTLAQNTGAKGAPAPSSRVIERGGFGIKGSGSQIAPKPLNVSPPPAGRATLNRPPAANTAPKPVSPPPAAAPKPPPAPRVSAPSPSVSSYKSPSYSSPSRAGK